MTENEGAQVMTPRDWIWTVVVVAIMIAAGGFLILIAVNGLMLPPSRP